MRGGKDRNNIKARTTRRESGVKTNREGRLVRGAARDY